MNVADLSGVDVGLVGGHHLEIEILAVVYTKQQRRDPFCVLPQLTDT